MERKDKSLKLTEKDKWFLSLHHEIPLKFHIFSNSDLTIFESLVKYLKEIKSFNFHEISLLLNRNERNIWTTYKSVLKKEGKNAEKEA